MEEQFSDFARKTKATKKRDVLGILEKLKFRKKDTEKNKEEKR